MRSGSGASGDDITGNVGLSAEARPIAVVRTGGAMGPVPAQLQGAMMPSKSPAQARMMAAAAHNPAFAKKVGVPVKVAEEFNSADAGTGILKAKRNARPGGWRGKKTRTYTGA